jgi:hypothetical protein
MDEGRVPFSLLEESAMIESSFVVRHAPVLPSTWNHSLGTEPVSELLLRERLSSRPKLPHVVGKGPVNTLPDKSRTASSTHSGSQAGRGPVSSLLDKSSVFAKEKLVISTASSVHVMLRPDSSALSKCMMTFPYSFFEPNADCRESLTNCRPPHTSSDDPPLL